MNILVMTLSLPYPPYSGTKLRVLNLFKRVSPHHDVHLISFVEPEARPSDIDFLKKFFKSVVTIPNPFKISLWKMMLNLLSPQPFKMTQFYDKRFMEAIRLMTKRTKIDLIIIEHLFLGPYALMRELTGIPKILTAQNIEHILVKRYQQFGGMSGRIYGFSQWSKLKKFERKMYHYVDQVIAVSELDRQGIVSSFKISPEKISVVENGVDTNDYYYCAPSREKPFKIIFTGSLNYYPNRHGVQYFANRVFPQLKSVYDKLEFYVIGDKPSFSLKNLNNNRDIFVLGRVDDVRPYIAQASIAIIPLMMGGGTRLKILEALSMGKPVVSTTIGCEGLHLVHGVDILIADSAGDFVQYIKRLFEDDHLYQTLSKNGREKAVNFYDWRIASTKFNSVVDSFNSKSLTMSKS